MFTPQEVSDKTFPKSSFGSGGYNMAAVDEFLDSLTEDYTALYKDNATLKAKLKVLAEKIEEYRATEDAMRSTLLTAQKMAAQLVQQAQVEKQQILSEAQEEATKQTAALEAQTRQAEQKLALAQQKLADFIGRSRELCEGQAAFLKTLPELDLALPQEDAAAEEDEIVLAAEKDILGSLDLSAEDAPAPAAEAPAAPASEEAPAAEAPAEPAPAPEAPAAETPAAPVDPFATTSFNLEDLKFGRNYGGDNN